MKKITLLTLAVVIVASILVAITLYSHNEPKYAIEGVIIGHMVRVKVVNNCNEPARIHGYKIIVGGKTILFNTSATVLPGSMHEKTMYLYRILTPGDKLELWVNIDDSLFKADLTWSNTPQPLVKVIGVAYLGPRTLAIHVMNNYTKTVWCVGIGDVGNRLLIKTHVIIPPGPSTIICRGEGYGSLQPGMKLIIYLSDGSWVTYRQR